MPSGPDGFVRHPRYQAEFDRARDVVLGHPGRWRVVYHYDGDGIAAASALLRTLERLGCPAQATALVGVEREKMAELVRATPGPMIVVDTGASWLDLFRTSPHPVVVLDHHRYAPTPGDAELPPHVAFVNPLDWGVDGMDELCGATLAWLFGLFLDAANWDAAPWGLSGAIHDRQHVGGFRGLNATLVDLAVAKGLLEKRAGVALFGATVAEAIAGSIDPFLRGLSGRPEAAADFARTAGVDPGARPEALSASDAARLAQAIKEKLAHDGVLPEFRAMVDAPRWFVPSLGLDAEELSNRQNAAGRMGAPGVGVAYSLGDPTCVERCRSAEADWRAGVLRGLRRIEDGDIHPMPSLRWFESPEMPLAGTQAGLAMTYLLSPEVPVFVFSERAPAPTKVSSRGLTRQVERGLDLAHVCRTAAQAVGGEGGGHRVASGATIPPGARDAFLAVADRELALQLGAPGAPA